MKKTSLVVLILLTCAFVGDAQTRRLKVATLDFGASSLGRLAADRFSAGLKSFADLDVTDRELSRVAAQGAGYPGSLNLTLNEARDIGAAIGCDFYVLGDAQTLRRTTSSNPVYFESYASIFLVSSRTGKLVMWERRTFSAPVASEAEQRLLAELTNEGLFRRYATAIQRANTEEKEQRELAVDKTIPVIEEAPDDEKAAQAAGLRLPRPYRRLRPVYPDAAAQADAEAVVDVLVDLDASGEVSRVDVTRWAGFGLDEATVSTVRKLHFFPALRDGNPIPIRVLLRYNFRRQAQ